MPDVNADERRRVGVHGRRLVDRVGVEQRGERRRRATGRAGGRRRRPTSQRGLGWRSSSASYDRQVIDVPEAVGGDDDGGLGGVEDVRRPPWRRRSARPAPRPRRGRRPPRTRCRPPPSSAAGTRRRRRRRHPVAQRSRRATGRRGRRRRTCPTTGAPSTARGTSSTAMAPEPAGRPSRRAAPSSTSPRRGSAAPESLGDGPQRPLGPVPCGRAGPCAPRLMCLHDVAMALPLMENFMAPSAHRCAPRSHGFHPLRVARVVTETADASSFVLDVPDELRAAFAYEPGQFCTFRVDVDGAAATSAATRCRRRRASTTTAGHGEARARRAGVELDARPPARGRRGRRHAARRASSSSPARATSSPSPAGAASRRCSRSSRRRWQRPPDRCGCSYANRDRDSVIFGAEIDELAHDHGRPLRRRAPPRRGARLRRRCRGPAFGGGDADDAEYYICGPAPFMDIVEQTLLAEGVDATSHPHRAVHAARTSRCADRPRPTPANGTTCHDRARRPHGRAPTTGPARRSCRPPGSSACHRRSRASRAAARRAWRGILEGAASMHVNNALTRRRGRGRVGAHLPVGAHDADGPRRLRLRLRIDPSRRATAGLAPAVAASRPSRSCLPLRLARCRRAHCRQSHENAWLNRHRVVGGEVCVD